MKYISIRAHQIRHGMLLNFGRVTHVKHVADRVIFIADDNCFIANRNDYFCYIVENEDGKDYAL